MSTDFTNRSTVQQLVAAFRQAEQEIRAAFAAIVAAQDRVNAVFALGGNPIRVDAGRGHYRDDFGDPDDAIGRMTREAWRCIVERLELRRMMSIKRYEELDRQLDREELPPISEEAVLAFVRKYADDMPTMIGEAIAEVFEWLTPQRGEYKTNDKFQVGERVVRTWMVERAWSGGGYRVRYQRQQHLTALENVFTALDGKGMISKTHYSVLQNAVEASPDGRAETPYFEARCFRNGNMHLKFKRLDLLKRFNELAGGRRMRPAA